MIVICSRCGVKFELARTKRKIGRLYGAGTYSDYFPTDDVCDKCASEEISADQGTGEEEIENTGSGWD